MSDSERSLAGRPFRIATSSYSGLPDFHPDDPVDNAFLSANRTAQQDAISRLSVGFPAFDWYRESQRTSGGTPMVAPIASELFESLDAAEVVDRVVSSMENSNRVGFSTETMQFAAGDYTFPDVYQPTEPPTRMVDVGRVAAAMDEGHSLVRNAADLDSREWWPMLADIERAVGGLAQVNVYLTNGSHPGFGPHWDDHEVLVIQVEGSKLWQFHSPLDLSPIRPLMGPMVGDFVGDPVRAEKGDAVWVPRGWGHTVLATDCASTHLTIGIHRPMWLDVAQTTAQLLKRHPRSRGYVPIDLDAEVHSYDGTGIGTPAGFIQEFEEVFSNVRVDRMIAASHAQRRPRQASSLRATISTMLDESWSEATVRSGFVGGVWPFEPPAQGLRAVVAGGRCYSFAEDIAPAVARLADARPATAFDLSAELGGDDIAALEVIEAAVRSGFAQVVS